jgi:Recombination endonuclease VII
MKPSAATSKAARERLRRAGLCVQGCGRQRDSKSKSNCRVCLDRHIARQQRNASLGRCRYHSDTVIEAGQRCRRCLEYRKRRRERALAKGVCPRHNEPLLTDRHICGKCRDMSAAHYTTFVAAHVCPSCKSSLTGNARRCATCALAYRRARLTKFGLTLETYDALCKAQGNLCAVCRRPERRRLHGRVTQLAVDHSHVSGKVRGLLCACCNRALGLLRDDIQLIDKMIAYLESHRRGV